MLRDILGDSDPGDENDSQEELEDAIGEDLQEGYLADYAPINFIDPGLLIAVAQLKTAEIITQEEARELLGLGAGE